MNTINSGNHNQSTEVPPPDDSSSTTRRPWLIVLLGILALLLAVFVATQVIGVLYAIVFPANAPLPPDITESSHKNLAYGVDEWIYITDAEVCDIMAFYQEQADDCLINSIFCGDENPEIPMPGQHIGRCSGEVEFSIFAMRWEVIISTGDTRENTQFLLAREVFWTGAVPPPMDLPAPGL